MNELKVFEAPGSQLPIHAVTNGDRTAIAKNAIQAIKDGKMSALEAIQSIKALQDVLDQVYKDPEFRDALLGEAAAYEKSFTLNGNKLEKAEAGVKYDFSQCNDPIYKTLLVKFNEAQAALKEREAFLKRIPTKGLTQVDEGSGEVHTIYPPSKTSTSIIKVTLDVNGRMDKTAQADH